MLSYYEMMRNVPLEKQSQQHLLGHDHEAQERGQRQLIAWYMGRIEAARRREAEQHAADQRLCAIRDYLAQTYGD